MAGIEHEGGVAGADAVLELRDAQHEIAPRQVLAQRHLEAELLQRLADGAGVVHRLPERLDVLIGVLADDQRVAVLRRGSRRKREHENCGKGAKHDGPQRLGHSTGDGRGGKAAYERSGGPVSDLRVRPGARHRGAGHKADGSANDHAERP